MAPVGEGLPAKEVQPQGTFEVVESFLRREGSLVFRYPTVTDSQFKKYQYHKPAISFTEPALFGQVTTRKMDLYIEQDVPLESQDTSLSYVYVRPEDITITLKNEDRYKRSLGKEHMPGDAQTVITLRNPAGNSTSNTKEKVGIRPFSPVNKRFGLVRERWQEYKTYPGYFYTESEEEAVKVLQTLEEKLGTKIRISQEKVGIKTGEVVPDKNQELLAGIDRTIEELSSRSSHIGLEATGLEQQLQRLRDLQTGLSEARKIVEDYRTALNVYEGAAQRISASRKKAQELLGETWNNPDTSLLLKAEDEAVNFWLKDEVENTVDPVVHDREGFVRKFQTVYRIPEDELGKLDEAVGSFLQLAEPTLLLPKEARILLETLLKERLARVRGVIGEERLVKGRTYIDEVVGDALQPLAPEPNYDTISSELGKIEASLKE